MKPKQGMAQAVLAALLVGAMHSLAWAAPKQHAPTGQVTMGSVAMDIPVEMIKRMSALTNYLALSTDLNIRFRPSPNLGSAVEELGTGQTQIAYLTPVAYIEARRKYGVIPLVAPTIQGRPYFSLVIGVKAGSGITTPVDLKGKRFAFGDEKALLQRASVESMGVKMADFSRFAYLKHYDNIAKAVLAGDFDGGILKDSVADDFKNEGIVVIGSTPSLPSYIFAVNPGMPVAVRNKLRDALLALKKTTPDGSATLEAFDRTYDGFAVVDDQAYDPVRKLIQPYQK
ncbi:MULTISPECIES: PhnD/SsuA/transferrin family substrate-binding protein [unclassified Thiobacillus]|uniref:PhnD/SsuA/transferrin family substrate-binding protein n=1 Tax=unclassified Thiobacillus TaxID=2646513 RepID=UPI000A400934|nr:MULTISPECIES: PhnD/SsuA/transferrin family substrate-binding protein [unclassified Thiobacillus]MBN8779404.1 PhnD/SsuA/transferrin family substrate-binding protein [Thiobacillus sp.]